MLQRTHIPEARWWVVDGVNKKAARLNCIHHLPQQIPYDDVPHTPVVLPARGSAQLQRGSPPRGRSEALSGVRDDRRDASRPEAQRTGRG